MSAGRRIRNAMFGIVMISCALILLFAPDDGYYFMFAILEVSLLLYGLRRLIFYITMARYMVGGQMVLIKSLVILDFALILWSVSEIPKFFVLLYLVVGLAFSGLVDVLRAFESRKHGSEFWKVKFIQGMITITVSLAGLIWGNSVHTIVQIFCIGLFSSAFTRLADAFRKTAIVYIK